MRITLSGFTKEGSTAEAMWCVLGPGPDWMPCNSLCWSPAMAGDVKAAAAILQIVRARVPPIGLELAEGFGVKSGTPRTVVRHPHGDLAVPHALGCMPQPTYPASGRQTTQFELSPVAWPITSRFIADR
jgi:hypothetical protein